MHPCLIYFHRQSPQCEGANQGRYVFDSNAAVYRSPIYRVITNGTEFAINAGDAHGVTQGAEFTAYASASSKNPLGRLVVVGTSPYQSKADLITGCSPFEVTETTVAVETRRSGAESTVCLYIEPNEMLLALSQRIEEDMKTDGLEYHRYTLVNNAESKDPVVDVCISLKGEEVIFEIMDATCRLHGLEHIPSTVNVSDINAVHNIVKSISNFYWHLRRTAPLMAAPQKPLADFVSLKCHELVEKEEDFDFVYVPIGDNLVVEESITVKADRQTPYGFEITNNTKELELFVSVFCFDISTFQISELFKPTMLNY